MESVEGGEIRGRYSFIGLKPDLIWRCFGDRTEINRTATIDPDAFVPCPVAEKSGAIDSLRAVVGESRILMPQSLPPMASSLVGYMSYDMVRLAEKLPDDNPDVLGVPDSIFRAYDIRGIVGETLTNEVVFQIGQAIGSEAIAQGEKTIAVSVEKPPKECPVMATFAGSPIP